MSQLRRRFLQQVGAAAAVLVLGKSADVLAASSKKPAAAKAQASSGDLSVAAFAPLVGRAFQLEHDGNKALDLKLSKVVPLKSTKGYADEAKARENAFTLVFQSAEKSSLSEGIYDFSTSGRATFSAFMSPILGDGRSYQVVFNRT
jgi:hypothetical protein